MSLEQEAKAAALAAYPLTISAEGTVPMNRVPYAHGYQAGRRAALRETANQLVKYPYPTAEERADQTLESPSFVAGAIWAVEELVRCGICAGMGEHLSPPNGGSWWAHREHPADGHDFLPCVSVLDEQPLTELEVDAAARALNPEAWNVYDDPRATERDMIVEGSRARARAALEAARAAR